MNLAILLHIYQPPTQDSKVLRQITDVCYLPLIKSIRNKLNLKITLNMPLSLAYQLHQNKYDSLLQKIKELYEEDRLELTSTGAFHPLFTRIPSELIEKELILNEFGLGYYLGKNKGFEGEDAILMKNLNGVFPPEMAVNQNVIETLDKLGYSWVAVDEVSLAEDYLNNKNNNVVFSYDRLNIKVVTRNTKLSNMISFKRDTNIEDITNTLLGLRQENSDVLIAMDGEFFGWHFNEGLYLFDLLVNKIQELGINMVTTSELIEGASTTKIETIHEATWGASNENMKSGELYPMWHISGNKIQDLLWKLYNRIVETDDFRETVGVSATDKHEFVLETFPVWDVNELDKLKDVPLKNKLYKDLLLLQSLNSDQFWWASKAAVGGVEMYSKHLISNSLDLYKKYALVSGDKDLQEFVDDISNQIKTLL